MSTVAALTKRLLTDEDGATAIEYGLLAALIAVALLTMVMELGDTLGGAFSTVNSTLVAQVD
jgi:pilus assembly protein Flp/PilA